ncbi:MAG: PEP-CTERM sorting domain-containing protein [Candidatus Nealsonbacteria bacterium]|nr:PEP-CTERM sorting domain-containing protein [Candidatus Nealsonbacteria bacterium]
MRYSIGTFTCVLLISALACATSAQAETIIDFEEFGDGDNLHNLDLGGVTLLGYGSNVEVFDNRFGAGFHSSTKSISSPLGAATGNPLVGVFHVPVQSLSLWAGDSGGFGELDSWRLEAYDAPAGGNLVAAVSSIVWDGAPYQELSVAGETIWRFEANWTGPTNLGIAFDDLHFQAIPEPSSLVLAVVGLAAGLLFARRRRAQ